MKTDKKEKNEMKVKDVIEVLQYFKKNSVLIWLDGGWAVDALLKKQTRPHNDLDIVVQKKDVFKIRRLLKVRGYGNIERSDTSSWNFVLGDKQGREIDIHVVVFDKEGNGLYGPKKRGIMYPAESFGQIGLIEKEEVRCITASQLVKFHTGYELDENDIKDVKALCKRFKIALPSEYKRYDR